MVEDLTAYTRAIAGLLGLPEARDRAVADAQRAGQERIDQALATQRRHAESTNRASRLVEQAQSSLRRLELRTGEVEALAAEDVPRDVESLPQYLDELIRDLEASEKAQQWVENFRAQQELESDRLAARQSDFRPANAPPVPVEPTALVRPSVPPRTALLLAAIAALVLVAITVFLVLQ
ncbi:hypothetical protein [Raineyella fluvialis]|uniref:Uncharacterized protein n=1 Tax=Raineyella fluvialis TaxID=2662261 RepID=A0A5Q2FCB1_9ACTN|nr:hypothetical protein [Raineyella fluvialis]QGF23377.1 hypothetical protein Rai3103_06550 [Raineyella fluvialis]